MGYFFRNRSFTVSLSITIAFFFVGISFLLLEIAEYNWIFFFALPLGIGISIGILPDRKWAIIGCVLATLISLLLLLLNALSGMICILMSIPLIIIFVGLGALLADWIERNKNVNSDKLPILLLPLLAFMIGAPLHKYLNKDKQEIISVATEQVFNYSNEEVYDAIKSVDTMDAEKPLLMKFDLPVPIKCVLEKEELGGKRTCYFKGGNFSRGDFGGGTITERITELEKGKVLKMDVTDYNLIGRKWLGFKEAIYYFTKLGPHKCKLTRITTYTSILGPRFYWEPMEKWGILQEHDYVFANLAKDLKKKYKMGTTRK